MRLWEQGVQIYAEEDDDAAKTHWDALQKMFSLCTGYPLPPPPPIPRPDM